MCHLVLVTRTEDVFFIWEFGFNAGEHICYACTQLCYVPLFVTPGSFPLTVRWQLVLCLARATVPGSCKQCYGEPCWCLPPAAPANTSGVPGNPKGRAVVSMWYCSHLKPPDFIRSPLLEMNSKRTNFLILCISALLRCQLCLFWELAHRDTVQQEGTPAKWCPESLVRSMRRDSSVWEQLLVLWDLFLILPKSGLLVHVQ